MQFRLTQTKGFTIVELLIVIVVIAILASISIVAYSGVQTRARDTARLNDARVITQAIAMYHIDNSTYFEESSGNGDWELSSEDSPGDFLETLVNDNYLTTVPLDPDNSSSAKAYYYYVYPAGYVGCDVARGKYYVFGIKDMENSDRPHPDSPGWSCPSRNWQNEYDWVTGAFEFG